MTFVLLFLGVLFVVLVIVGYAAMTVAACAADYAREMSDELEQREREQRGDVWEPPTPPLVQCGRLRC